MPEHTTHLAASDSRQVLKRRDGSRQRDKDAQTAKLNAAAAARRDVLSSLRSTTVVLAKPVLPTSIISRVLDNADARTLIRCAKVSRRLRDTVYNETRWIRRLEAMGIPAAPGISTLQQARKATSPPMAMPKQDPLTVIDFTIQDLSSPPRQRYGHIHSALHPFYGRLDGDDKDAMTAVMSAYGDVTHQATLLANLVTFSACDFTINQIRRRQQLTKIVDRLGSDTLASFQSAYALHDFDRMKGSAQTAVILGKGPDLVTAHVDSLPLIRGEVDLPDLNDCLDGVATGHIDLGPVSGMFDLVSAAVSEQVGLTERVFPANVQILSTFLVRLTETTVRPFVEKAIALATDQGPETFVKAVSGIYKQSMEFADSIVSYKISFPDQIRTTLSEIFTPQMYSYLSKEGSLYMKKADAIVAAWEDQLLQQDARTESFLMSNVNRQAAKRDFLAVFKRVVLPYSTTKADVLTPVEKDAPTTELAAKMALLNSRLEGIKSLLSVEVAVDLINLAKTAIERMAVFVQQSGPHQFQKQAMMQCDLIFVDLIGNLGDKHIKIGFDKAIAHLGSYSVKTNAQIQSKGVEPLVTFLELVNLGDLIQQMVDVFYAQELIRVRLAYVEDFVNPAVKAKKRFEQMLDERVATGLNKGIDVLMDQVEHLCATTQQATDYNPPTPLADIGPSRTAVLVVETMKNHTSMLTGSTNRQMLDVFLQEVGSRLFTAVCKHIKRQRISVDGAMTLIR